jgi:hypothetical protein
MADVKMTIQGIQKLQAVNVRMIAALKPSNALGRAIRFATAEAHRYLVTIIHRDTGAYAAAQRMGIEAGGARGVVYTDPGATNPRSGQKPVDYGPHEEARGGSHAAYQRTVSERGKQIGARTLQYLDEALIVG